MERGGRWFLLHHANQTDSFENVGRQVVPNELKWTTAGWPEFLNYHIMPVAPAALAAKVVPAVLLADEFSGRSLATIWEWPVEDKPQFALSEGRLELMARPDKSGAVLSRPTLAANYEATTTLLNPTALLASTTAGLAAPGDPNNSLNLLAGDGKLRIQERRASQNKVLAETI